MKLALFDLDHTLLSVDSETQWLELAQREHPEHFGDTFKKNLVRFSEDYQQGRLDMVAYTDFATRPMRELSTNQLTRLTDIYTETLIPKFINHAGLKVINDHKRQGDFTVIITASNRYIADKFNTTFRPDHIICIELEADITQRITGKINGEPCMAHGKNNKLRSWLQTTDRLFHSTTFYSDSHNDLPLLSARELVDYPVAVDPDPILRAIASKNDWPIVTFKGQRHTDMRLAIEK